MSNHTTVTPRQINIPDNTEGTHTAVEYGCRFPDGHHEWETFKDYNGTQNSYASIVEGNGKFIQSIKDRWLKTLQSKAEYASVHPSEFIEEHTLVKRTIILVTTAAEEV